MNTHTNKELTQKIKKYGLEPKNKEGFHFSEIRSQLEKLGLPGRENYFDGLVKNTNNYWQEWLDKWL